jgi:glycosyltransferase involved in cell wall biosynthesis
MKILHITQRHIPEDGGLYVAVNDMVAMMRERGHCAEILSVGQAGDEGGTAFRLLASRAGRSWLWHPRLKADIDAVVGAFDPDILHIHGVWMAAQLFALSIGARRKVPTVLSTHNFLDAWLMAAQSSLKMAKKVTYWRLFGGQFRRRSGLVHAVTKREEQHLKGLGFSGSMVHIPNSHPIQDRPPASPRPPKKDYILFLGRIDPVKGIDLIVRALPRLSDRSIRLKIAGPTSDEKYRTVLEQLVFSLELQNRVEFVGPVYGEEKGRLIDGAWIGCVPSHTEVIGLVNLECASMGVPTITTVGTGLTDWPAHGGLLVEAQEEALVGALTEALSWSEGERQRRGAAMRDYVRSEFNPAKVGGQWDDAYAQVLRAVA